MPDEDSILSQYIAKVMLIQESHQNRPLNAQDLQLISEELNLSAEDVEAINTEFKGYLHRGIGFMKFKNWNAAVEELEQALCLKPYHYGALVSLSGAYEELFYKEKKDSHREKSLDLSRRCLQVAPTNEDALRIITHLEMTKKDRLKSSVGNWAGKTAVVIALLALVLVTTFTSVSLTTILTFFAIIVCIIAGMMLVLGMM